MNVTVPSFAPGDGSLPADVRAGRAGLAVDGRMRLLMGQRHTGMRVEPMQWQAEDGMGMGDILAGNFVVPQNPMRIKLSTGTSGVGRLRRLARLQGLGQCDPTQDDYDPDLCAQETGIPEGTLTATPAAPTYLPALSTPDASGCIQYDTMGNCVQTAPSPFLVSPSGPTPASLGVPSTLTQAPAGYTGPTSVAGNAATPAAPSGYQWANVVNQSGNTLAKVLTIAQGGAAITLPNGNQLLYGSPTSALTAGTLGAGVGAFGTALGQMSPVLLIGGLALVLLVMSGNRGR
jgi:hypothetical protein